jgi:hypothetical protein
MGDSELRALEMMLGQLRAVHEELAERHAGIAVLHIDAATAALESHIRRLSGVQTAHPSAFEAHPG